MRPHLLRRPIENARIPSAGGIHADNALLRAAPLGSNARVIVAKLPAAAGNLLPPRRWHVEPTQASLVGADFNAARRVRKTNCNNSPYLLA